MYREHNDHKYSGEVFTTGNYGVRALAITLVQHNIVILQHISMNMKCSESVSQDMT